MSDHGWRTSRTEVDVIHIWPVGDLIDHDLGDTGDCMCGPTVRLHQGTPVGDFSEYRHHSLDGREYTTADPSIPTEEES